MNIKKLSLLIVFLFLTSHSFSQSFEFEKDESLSNSQERASNFDMLMVQVYTVENMNNGGNPHDGIGIMFSESYNDGFDNGDALKPRNIYENFARVLENRLISLERRKNPVPGLSLELHLSGYTRTEYAFTANFRGLEAYDIFIDDTFTGQSHLLTEDGIVYFSLTTQASRAANRFFLRFELKDNTYLYQNGNWTPNHPSGISGSNDAIYVVNGTTTLSNVTTIKDMRINQAAEVAVDGILNLHGNLEIEGSLTFKSTSTKYGELGYVGVNSVISGDVTVENFMKNRRAYRMLSSSVTTFSTIQENLQEGASHNLDDPHPGFGTHITGSTVDGQHGFDGTISGNPSMFTLDAANRTWVPVANTNEDSLIAGDPFLLFVRGHRGIDLTSNTSQDSTVLRATGMLYTGQHSQDFPAFDEETFAMFGNPYVSAVDVNTVFSNSENVNPFFYYLYDPSLGSNGGYVTVSLPEGGNNVGSSFNQYLQPGQAAQFTTLNAGTSSIVFTENAKAPGNFLGSNAVGNDFFAENLLKVKLFSAENYDSGKSAHDGFVLLFSDEYQNEITPEDALKPMNYSENLAVNNQNKLLSIERRKMPVASEILQIYSDGYSSTSYVLSIDLERFYEVDFFIDDAYTGESTPLENGENNFSFLLDENPLSRASDRFSIRVESSLGVDQNLLTDIRFFPNPTDTGTFYIHAPKLNGEQVEISISDFSGRNIYTTTILSMSNKIVVTMDDAPASGIYLVTLKLKNESNTFRLIKR